MPVLHAISANDAKTTATVIFQTLMQLEPESCQKLHALMVSNELLEAFTSAITEVVKPPILSVQSTIDNMVQGYINCLDTSLDCQRLDTLIHSLLRQTETYFMPRTSSLTV